MLFPEYLSNIEKSKQHSYASGFEAFMKFKWAQTYELMLKKRETQIATADKVKPRLLMNPTDQVKASVGWTSYNLLQLFKYNTPEFIHGKNCHDLADHLEHAVAELGSDVVFISFDGSKYDAHQHESLKSAVDHRFYAYFLDEILVK